jgi:hypothetical protein
LLSANFSLVLLLLIVIVVLFVNKLDENFILDLFGGFFAALLSNLTVENAPDLNVSIMLLFLLMHVLLLGFLVRLDATSDVLFLLLFLELFVFVTMHPIPHLIHDSLNLMFTFLDLVVAFLDRSFHISFCLLNQLDSSLFVNFFLLLPLLFFHFVLRNDQPCSLSLCLLLPREVIALNLQIFLKFLNLIRLLFFNLLVLVVFFSLSFF